jgi:hypothetical protein
MAIVVENVVTGILRIIEQTDGQLKSGEIEIPFDDGLTIVLQFSNLVAFNMAYQEFKNSEEMRVSTAYRHAGRILYERYHFEHYSE